MAVRAEIKDIVANISKNVSFLQPIYEAITNSLEANATSITIRLYSDDSVLEHGRLSGFDVSDNGEGFTEKNLRGFCTLWTDNKRDIGCKGSGRFMWLSVFNDIHIVSCISSLKQKIEFDFNLSFDYEQTKISKTDYNECQNKTVISFRNVTSAFKTKVTKKGTIDKRDFANPYEIKTKIIDYLLVKLFLLKRENKTFVISIVYNDEKEEITNNDIPDLEEKEFDVVSDLTGDSFTFTAYYLFSSDGKNSKKMSFCANSRSTKVFESGQLGFSAPLPNNDSFTMLVCSNYFENKDNDSRNNFDELANLKNQTLFAPLLISDIFAVSKKYMRDIIFEHYPKLNESNQKAEDEAIDLYPYLAKYIKEDEEITKTSKSLITNANKKLNKEKEIVRDNFKSALEKRNVDTVEFENAINQVSIMAAIELSEYIHYRDNIIKALTAQLDNDKYKEDFYHNILIPKGTDSFADSPNKHLYSNLWLLDDKFMTYSYVGSNISIGRIIENNIKEEADSILNRPDVTLIFNRKEGHRDAIMIELKGATASFEEKKKSITELPDDIGLLRSNMEDLQMIWGYIITSIDSQIETTLLNQDFKPLFVAGDKGKMYYKNFGNLNAHIYVCDFETIAKDAEARNQTFLEILKQK